MIITEKLDINITNKNLSYYRNKGYLCDTNTKIEISVIDLPPTSKTIIRVSCDECGKEKDIIYFSYLRNISKYGYYTCSPKCAIDKTKKTNLKKYGVESFTKTEEYLLKTKKTKLEKYGDENYINIDKQKETNLFKYGKESYMSTDRFRIQSKDTIFEKYGVVHQLQSDEIKNKIKTTNNEKYGCDHVLQSEEVKIKISITKKEKYNDINYNNREKYKETCLDKFGFDNPMKNEFIKQKLSNIIFEKYGVRYPSQSDEIYKKMIDSGYRIEKFKNTELYYQGTYELDFLEKYYHLINIERGESIKYIFKDEEHIYFPDFFIEELNLIIEIKSSKWFEEHKEKNLCKEKSCKEKGYNFLFIIDKNYNIFNNVIKFLLYKKEHCWQYDLKLINLESDINNIEFDYTKLKVSDFEFKYIDKTDKECENIKRFIEKYEWLGKMPNRPTHRFAAYYKDILCGVIIMATPNTFSKLIGDNTKNLEKLISRGATISWAPKNLGSSLIMWSIKWMVKNTNFRIFTAYSDPEANEIGTIYQACNFLYLGQNSGTDKLYFDISRSHLGWITSRTFRKKSSYKEYAKILNIEWKNDWIDGYTILWDKMPLEISNKLKEYSKKYQNNCLVRNCRPKHKYCYILGENNTETKYLVKLFNEKNKIFNYPKRIKDYIL